MSDNTKASLDTMFKYKVAQKVNELVPSCSKLQEMMGPLQAAQREGRKFLWPVMLTHEHGVTYGNGTAFTFGGAIAAAYDEIEVESNPIVLQSRISIAAANRMETNEQAFETNLTFRAGVLKESLMRRLEVETILGKASIGIGVITGAPVQVGATTEYTATITDATWAPGIWSGAENVVVDVYQANGTLRTADVVVTSTDHDNKTVNLQNGSAVATTDVLFFRGAKTNCFSGLFAQLENSGTLFGINAALYSLWKANTFAVGGQLTMAKALEGASKAVGKGGLEEDCILVIPSRRYEKLNIDLAALVHLGKEKNAEIGFNYIKYRAQFGLMTVMPHNCMPEGYAMLIPKACLIKVGAKDVSFGYGGGEYFVRLENVGAYQFLAQADWTPIISAPAKCVLYTGITD